MISQVFELAAYRHANPHGKITLVPLFMANVILLLFFSMFALGGAVMAGILLGTADPGGNFGYFGLLFAVLCPPVSWAAHIMRRNVYEKQSLLESLQEYQLSNSLCRMDFDRAYVHKAICTWYGSIAGFEEYVQGPLQRELTGNSYRLALPFNLRFLILLPVINVGVEEVLSLGVAGAPFECLLCQLLGQSLAANILWGNVSINLFVTLCERLASPARNVGCDCLKSVFIYLAFMGTLLGGNFVSLMTRETHIWAVVAWSACVFFCTLRV